MNPRTLPIIPHISITRYGICSQMLEVGGMALELLVGDAWAAFRLGQSRWPAVIGQT